MISYRYSTLDAIYVSLRRAVITADRYNLEYSWLLQRFCKPTSCVGDFYGCNRAILRSLLSILRDWNVFDPLFWEVVIHCWRFTHHIRVISVVAEWTKINPRVHEVLIRASNHKQSQSYLNTSTVQSILVGKYYLFEYKYSTYQTYSLQLASWISYSSTQAKTYKISYYILWYSKIYSSLMM